MAETFSYPLGQVAARVGRLRAFGNGIAPQCAEEVIASFTEYRP